MTPWAQVKQVMRFAGVGSMASATYFVLALILNGSLGVATVVASVVAYALAAFISFFGHKYFTFQQPDAQPAEIPKFVVTVLTGLLIASAIPIMLQAFAPIVSFLSVLILVPATSYLMIKFFVFRS